MFKHELVDLGYNDLSAVTTESNRTYATPNGNNYDSITSVLSHLSKPGILAWRERVGAEEANRISKFASTRGNAVHDLLERYIKNEDIDWSKVPLHIKSNFNEVKEEIDNKLQVVHAQEVALYSDYLKVAGRVDCVGVWDGKIAIIDFKTSGKWKEHEHCWNYFMQEAFYAIAWEERTGIPITSLVTIIAGDAGKQIFVEDRREWEEALMRVIMSHHKRNGTE